jgi:hypothetical protein
MTTKKGTKKPTAKSTPAPRTIDARDLAALLAAVFTHPLLPRVMWEHIADALCEIDNTFDKYGNPEVMREVLGLNGRQKGGKR